MSDVLLDKSTLDAAIEYGKKIGAPVFVAQEPIHFAASADKDGKIQITSLKDYQFPHGIPPDHIKAEPSFQGVASFCAYVASYQTPYTRLFADSDNTTFQAIIDYHKPGPSADSAANYSTEALEPTATFCQHRPNYTMKTSPQWNEWWAKNNKDIAQVAWAEHCEDQGADFVNPPSAAMLEIAREMTARSEVSFQSKINRANGTATLHWSEDLKTSGDIQVPERFTIMIPVFFGEQPIPIECILRFRISSGKLSFLFKMLRASEIKMDAFKLAVAKVSETLGTPVHLGRP